MLLSLDSRVQNRLEDGPHSQSFRKTESIAVLDFARSAFGVRCVLASLLQRGLNLQKRPENARRVDALTSRRYTDSECTIAQRARLMARGSSALARRFGAQKARGAFRLMRFSMQRSSSSGSMCLYSSCSCRSWSRIYTRFQKFTHARGASCFSPGSPVLRLAQFFSLWR